MCGHGGRNDMVAMETVKVQLKAEWGNREQVESESGVGFFTPSVEQSEATLAGFEE